MDDPFVALSLWQGQDNSSKNTSTFKNGNAVHDDGTNFSGVGTNKKLVDKKTSEDRKSNSPSSGNCFPCLSGLELDSLKTSQKKEKEVCGDGGGLELVCNGGSEEVEAADVGKAAECEALATSPLPHLDNYWLLRLFESNLFTIDKALQYLHTEKDRNVQEYLGKKLFVRN